MFVAVFIEYRIGVVDVNQDFAALGVGGKLRQQTVASGKRQMAHFARGFVAAPGLNEFVVRPERAVEKRDAAGSGGFERFDGSIRNRR
jgi:hypothetical protein